MEYHSFFRAPISISRIGLGTAQFGSDYGFTKEKSFEEVKDILDCCHDYGVNFIDTAPSYGNSEEKIGRYVKASKKKFVIATKIAKITPDLMEDKTKLNAFVRKSLLLSLDRFGLDVLDLLLLHQTEDFILGNPLFWEVMAELRKEGLFKLAGLSVYDVEPTEAIIKKHSAAVDFIQAPFNVFDQRFSQIFSLLEEKKINVISRSIFLKGVISCDVNAIPSELSGIKEHRSRLSQTAQKFNLHDNELSLLSVLKAPGILSTIVGVNSATELKWNIDVLLQKQWSLSLQKAASSLAVNDRFLTDPRKWRQL